jgi:cell volume regulation protein A
MGSARLDAILLLGAVVLLGAIVAVRYADRIGLPSLLAYLGIGLALQSVVRFNSASQAQALGLTALVLILAEGGLTTRWDNVRNAVPMAVLLAVVGVGVSMTVTAVVAHWIIGGDWRLAFLLGAIVSSTDAAAVFSVLRSLNLPRRLTGVLEMESGLNDAPAVIAVVLLSEEHPQTNAAVIAGLVIYELLAGGLIGFAVGWLGARRLQQVALPASGLYPVAVVALAVAGYAAASLAHASGFLAVYVTGVLLGNARLPHRPATRSFAEGLAWLAQIGLFVMLGLLVTPSALQHQTWRAIAVGAALLFLARPAAVVASMLPLRFPKWRRWGARYGMSWREGAFLSWAGLRGAVPIVLATVPITGGVAGSDRLLSLVFVLVVIFTLVQGPTLPVVARSLRLGVAGETSDLGVETAPLEQIDADLLQLTIPPGSQLHGVELFELRLPPGSAVSLVVRDGVGFVPNPETQLRAGDTLMIVATANTRLAAEQRLRAVSRRGKLAGWFGDRGADEA